MNKSYDITIVVKGPEHALQMFDRVCRSDNPLDPFGFRGVVLAENYMLDALQHRIYKFAEANDDLKYHFEKLCDIFKVLNLYYYSICEGKVFAIFQEDRVISTYVDPGDRLFHYYAQAKDNKVSLHLPMYMPDPPEGFSIGKPSLPPKSVRCIDAYFSWLFLVGTQTELSRWYEIYGGNNFDMDYYISMLMRRDSCYVIKQFEPLVSNCNVNPVSVNPLMFAIKIGKIDEFNMLKEKFPDWLTLTDDLDQSVLHYCVIANNVELYYEICMDLLEMDTDISKLTKGLQNLIDQQNSRVAVPDITPVGRH